MQNFWSFIWIVIWCFVFFAYLMVLFQILGDLFRDHQLAGIWKGVWILVLIFIPFLGALVYLIARGRGMSERQVAAAARDLLDVRVRLALRLPHGGHLALTHPAPACDQVHQRAQERDEDQHQNPDPLPDPGQLVIAEEVAQDLEEHHQVREEDEAPDDDPDKPPEVLHSCSLGSVGVGSGKAVVWQALRAFSAMPRNALRSVSSASPASFSSPRASST